jgi:hypothetical protein
VCEVESSSEVGVGVPWHMMCGIWWDLRLSFFVLSVNGCVALDGTVKTHNV